MRSIILIMVLITATLTGCGVVKDTEVPSGAFPGEYYQVTDDLTKSQHVSMLLP